MSSPSTSSAFLASRVGAVPITIPAGLTAEEMEAAANLQLGLEDQVAVAVYGVCPLPSLPHPPFCPAGRSARADRPRPSQLTCPLPRPRTACSDPMSSHADPVANELLVLDIVDRTGTASLLEEAVIDRCPFARAAWSAASGLDASMGMSVCFAVDLHIF